MIEVRENTTPPALLLEYLKRYNVNDVASLGRLRRLGVSEIGHLGAISSESLINAGFNMLQAQSLVQIGQMSVARKATPVPPKRVQTRAVTVAHPTPKRESASLDDLRSPNAILGGHSTTGNRDSGRVLTTGAPQLASALNVQPEYHRTSVDVIGSSGVKLREKSRTQSPRDKDAGSEGNVFQRSTAAELSVERLAYDQRGGRATATDEFSFAYARGQEERRRAARVSRGEPEAAPLRARTKTMHELMVDFWAPGRKKMTVEAARQHDAYEKRSKDGAPPPGFQFEASAKVSERRRADRIARGLPPEAEPLGVTRRKEHDAADAQGLYAFGSTTVMAPSKEQEDFARREKQTKHEEFGFDYERAVAEKRAAEGWVKPKAAEVGTVSQEELHRWSATLRAHFNGSEEREKWQVRGVKETVPSPFAMSERPPVAERLEPEVNVTVGKGDVEAHARLGRRRIAEADLEAHQQWDARADETGHVAPTVAEPFVLLTAQRARPTTLEPTRQDDAAPTAAHLKAFSARQREEDAKILEAERDAYDARMGRPPRHKLDLEESHARDAGFTVKMRSKARSYHEARASAVEEASGLSVEERLRYDINRREEVAELNISEAEKFKARMVGRRVRQVERV
jgi:hypothetical protein